MDLKIIRDRLLGDEEQRAVSPVIGVILMVAITVILAAVIAAFVMDIGDLDDSAPNAQFEWNTTDDAVASVTLQSGDNIDTDNLEVNGGEFEKNGVIDDLDNVGETWSAGETVEFNTSETENGVTITWEADGSSTIIAEEDP